MEPTSNKKIILWVVIALVVIALAAGWYYYGSYGGSAVVPTGEDAATAELKTQGASDETSAIEGDLNATDLEDLDKELSDIDATFAQ